MSGLLALLLVACWVSWCVSFEAGVQPHLFYPYQRTPSPPAPGLRLWCAAAAREKCRRLHGHVCRCGGRHQLLAVQPLQAGCLNASLCHNIPHRMWHPRLTSTSDPGDVG